MFWSRLFYLIKVVQMTVFLGAFFSFLLSQNLGPQPWDHGKILLHGKLTMGKLKLTYRLGKKGG